MKTLHLELFTRKIEIQQQINKNLTTIDEVRTRMNKTTNQHV